MAKDFLIITILTTVLSGTVTIRADAADSKKAKPLRDGFTLAGVDGKLTTTDSNKGSQRWLFELYSDVSDDKGRVKAGETLELLPSATLEKMTDDNQKRSIENYRLWGKVTKYQERNFIFPIYFLPIAKVKQKPPTPQKSQQTESQITETPNANATKQVHEPTINEPNDELAIPQEIIARLQTRRVVRPEQLQETQNTINGVQEPKKGLELKADCILADRTAFLVDQPDGGVTAVFDALGRNIPRVSFRLLPCEALQHAQRKQAAEADALRFKIAGIVTKYKGQYYLLLQRAIQLYSHQNFPR
ncbi:MAG: hypothetical protein ACYS0C_04805 [Planctomycetota bacterium]|jgi:hypothetical protein